MHLTNILINPVIDTSNNILGSTYLPGVRVQGEIGHVVVVVRVAGGVVIGDGVRCSRRDVS